MHIYPGLPCIKIDDLTSNNLGMNFVKTESDSDETSQFSESNPFSLKNSQKSLAGTIYSQTGSSLPNFMSDRNIATGMQSLDNGSVQQSSNHSTPYFKRTQSHEAYYEMVKPPTPILAKIGKEASAPPTNKRSTQSRNKQKGLDVVAAIQNLGDMQIEDDYLVRNMTGLTNVTEFECMNDDFDGGTSPFGWSDMTSECL